MWMRSILFACLLGGLTLWAYQSTRTAEWVYEDRATLTSATQAPGGWLTQRSLSNWTWRLTPTPSSAHLVSLALHLLIGGLVGLAAWRFGVTSLGAWVAAAVWLLLPLTGELAAYAKARADELVLVGVLLAAIAATGRWWRGWALVGIVAGGIVAVGAKQAGVVVLLLVPLVIWARHRTNREAPWWAPWWGPAVVAGVVAVTGMQWYGGLRSLVNADSEVGIAMAVDVTWWQWALAQTAAVWYWLMAAVWPAFVTPDVDVDRLSRVASGMGAFALLTCAWACWTLRTRHPAVSLSCGWIVCGVLPRLLIQTPRSYLSAAQFGVACVGLTLLAGIGVQRLRDHWVASSSGLSATL